MYDVDSYEEFSAAFSWDDYWDACDWESRSELNIAHEAIDRHRESDDALALVWVNEEMRTERYTFENIARESDRFANVLTDLGVNRGDRVFTHLPRIPEHYFAILGALKTGAIFGAINERYGVDGVEHRLTDARAKTVVTTPKNLGKIEQATVDVDSVEDILVIDRNDSGFDGDHVDYTTVAQQTKAEFETVLTGPDDPALLYYTSGTTGPAKGVLHAHRFTVGNAAFLDYPADVGEDDLYWVTGDPGWLTGLNLFGAWFWGVPGVVYAGEFDPDDWVQILHEHPVTILWSVPTAYRMLKEQDDIFDGKDIQLRNVLSVGEPLDAPVIEWAEEQFGTPILDSYGTSETYGAIVSNYPFMDVKPGCMGRPHPGVDIKVCEPGTLTEIEPGDVGEIVVREFPSSFIKYWNREEKTDSVTQDGWIFTDDLVGVDDEGYFSFQGRADDVILSSGYRIGPFDIESTLVGHEAVTNAAVVPKSDPERGNRIIAFVTTPDDVDPDRDLAEDIQRYVKQRLAKHEYPHDIRFIDELPQTVTGKIQRKELHDRLENVGR